MTLSEAAEQHLKSGDPSAALARLQEDVRAKPSDAKLRVFLFQLLCVLGQWERALNQLKVASELEPLALPMAQMYGDAVRCEAIRTEVFDGHKSPMILGEPEQWLAMLIESRLRAGGGEAAQSEELRLRAFEEAPTSGGDIDGRPFEWLADADSRLGPVMEAIINGRYYWVPFSRMTKISLDAPEDLARSRLDAGAPRLRPTAASRSRFCPTRYPGSEASERRRDRAGAQDVLGGDRRRRVPRARPADPRDRRRRHADPGSPRDLAPPGRGRGRRHSGRGQCLNSAPRRSSSNRRSSTG